MSAEERRIHDEGEALYRELGEFFLLWADVELELYRVLIHYAGVTDAVGRAIFSGCRAKLMIDYLKNIAHNTKIEESRVDDLEYLTSQINAINTIRDRIAHYGSASNFGVSHKTLQRSVSNFHRVAKKGNEFNLGVNSETVAQMADDLRRIHYRLELHYRKDAPTRLGGDVPRDGPTWRYTPVQPSNPKSKTNAVPQAPQRQKKSSPPK